LLVVDGHGGLKSALKRWEGVRVQRCAVHYADVRIMPTLERTPAALAVIVAGRSA
jgi:transposase-like protein